MIKFLKNLFSSKTEIRYIDYIDLYDKYACAVYAKVNKKTNEIISVHGHFSNSQGTAMKVIFDKDVFVKSKVFVISSVRERYFV